jgi:Fe-S-cluster-containing hydrogenase component 2
LALAYTLAGADCIDVAADPAVIYAAQTALQTAGELVGLARLNDFRIDGLPWLMVSLNDGEDPHFRKAEFDPRYCPTDCLRPCERVCPAEAIVFSRDSFSGVIDNRCYGCGRCIPICPSQQISTRSYVFTPSAVAPLVLSGVDAVEIHTQIGRLSDFKRLWEEITPFLPELKLIAISCPDGAGLVDYLWALHDLITPLPCSLVWQTDGRPMSGDIGDGATLAAVRLGQKVLAAGLPGYVQLAGGTNRYTVSKLKSVGLLKQSNSSAYVAGIAYGSYARTLLSPILERLAGGDRNDLSSETGESQSNLWLEESDLLWEAVSLAQSLVAPLKMQTNSPVLPVLE